MDKEETSFGGKSKTFPAPKKYDSAQMCPMLVVEGANNVQMLFLSPPAPVIMQFHIITFSTRWQEYGEGGKMIHGPSEK